MDLLTDEQVCDACRDDGILEAEALALWLAVGSLALHTGNKV